MDTESYYLMGTGSRTMVNHPNALDIYNGLKSFVLDMRERHSNLVLISGMAEGWDEAIAKIGWRENIPYVVAIPHPTYGEYYWRDHSQTKRNRFAMYQTLLASAQEVIIVSHTLYVDGVHANFIRNTWMVEHCNEAAVWMPHSSGTRDAVAKLNARKIPMTNFDGQGKYQPNLPL